MARGAGDEWLGVAPNFTPLAAIGLFAGFFFPRRVVALLVPLTAMVISNLCLKSYGSWLMLATVYCGRFSASLHCSLQAGSFVGIRRD